MKSDEILKQELEDQTKKVMDAAYNLCMEIYNLDKIEVGELETEEEKTKAGQFAFERDLMKKRALSRVLLECGNYLFL